jgi:hypothetical protein
MTENLEQAIAKQVQGPASSRPAARTLLESTHNSDTSSVGPKQHLPSKEKIIGSHNHNRNQHISRPSIAADSLVRANKESSYP